MKRLELQIIANARGHHCPGADTEHRESLARLLSRPLLVRPCSLGRKAAVPYESAARQPCRALGGTFLKLGSWRLARTFSVAAWKGKFAWQPRQGGLPVPAVAGS